MFLRAALAVAAVSAATSPLLPITLGGVVASHRADFASFGWEMWVMLNSYLRTGALADARLAAAARGLAPATFRVGGITGDWLRYTAAAAADAGADSGAGAGADDVASGSGAGAPVLDGFWPTAPQNFSHADFGALVTFARAANASLMFMLSELFGRDCQQPVPGCPACDKAWCVGEWDTSNVRAFLTYVHDARLLLPGDAFELGNELVGHLPAGNTTADIKTLAAIIDDVWADTPEDARPRLYAPSTDACGTPAQLEIMANITHTPRVAGFTFHAYPGQSGEGPNALIDILLNATWLRTQIMRGSEAYMCVDAWMAGPRAAALELLVTESSSSWNLPLPAPAQNSFLNGFFTIAELGQCVSQRRVPASVPLPCLPHCRPPALARPRVGTRPPASHSSRGGRLPRTAPLAPSFSMRRPASGMRRPTTLSSAHTRPSSARVCWR